MLQTYLNNTSPNKLYASMLATLRTAHTAGVIHNLACASFQWGVESRTLSGLKPATEKALENCPLRLGDTTCVRHSFKMLRAEVIKGQSNCV